MKKFVLLAITFISANAMAISFITEAQVGKKLEAQKVIEVSKYSLESLIKENTECSARFDSRSARAYVVKKEDETSLYITSSDLSDLARCTDL